MFLQTRIVYFERKSFEYLARCRHFVLSLFLPIVCALLSASVLAQDVATVEGSSVIADAGQSRVIEVGTAIRLDGHGSISISGSPLNYVWALVEKPAASQAVLQNPNSPTANFLPDVAGEYRAELIVTNAAGDLSDPSIVVLSTQNIAPVAMAGADRAMLIDQSIRLDPEGTYDANGDRLSATWSIASFQSPIVDSDPIDVANNNLVCPADTVESIGTYHVVSATSSQQNPQLAVGTPLPEGTVETGSNSATTYYGPITMDLTGDASVFVPEGEVIDVVLSSAWGTAARAEILMSLDGESYISLGTVGAGGSAYPAYSSNVLRYDAFVVPEGGARFLQVLQQNAGVRTDGVIYQTQCQSSAGGSNGTGDDASENAATLIEDAGGRYVFTPHLAGEYNVQLLVDDGQSGQSIDIVKIVVGENDGSTDPSALNLAPVANAGADQLIFIDQAVTLDGTLSTDVNGDSLTYLWTILSKPADSLRTIEDETSPIASFTPDTDRLYILQLVVTDSFGAKSYDTIILDGSAINPVARSGGPEALQDGAIIGQAASVDGSTSLSGNGQSVGLAYQWSVLGLSEGESDVENPTNVSTNINFQRDENDNGPNIGSESAVELLSDYNVIVFNDLDSNVDIAGRAFIGGQVFGESSTYGTQLPQGQNIDALTVIGDISGGPKNINNGGNLRHGGEVSSQVNLNGGGQRISDDTLSIISEQAALLSLSAGLSDIESNSIAQIPVFRNDRVQQIEVNANGAQAIIVNIGGADIDFTRGNFVGAVQNNETRQKIIWNFHEATDLFFDRAVHGTVLAPNAHLLNRTNVHGAVVVDSFQARGPISLPSFNGGGLQIDAADIETHYALVQLTVSDTNNASLPPVHDSVVLTTGNLRPVALITQTGGENPVEIGDEISLDATFSVDGNNDLLGYGWSILSKPSGSTLTLGANTSPSQTLVIDAPGTFVFQLIVNDGELASIPVTYTVTTGDNEAPTANAGPDQAVPAGQLVLLNGGASEDLDGDALTYAWSFISRPTESAATLTNANSVSPEFVADIPGDYIIALSVNDGELSSNIDEVRITATNIAPVAVISGPTIGEIGQALTFTAVGSSDADGDALTYIWTLASPSGSDLGVVEGTDVAFQFMPDIGGAYSVSLTVSDGLVLSETVTNPVTIEQPNSPPVLDAIDSQTVSVGSTVSVQFSATDPDGDNLTFSVSPSPLPAGASLNSDTGLFSYSALSSQPENLTFQVTASDGQASSTGAFSITVTSDDILETTYSGQVVDAITGEPIEGARVFIVNQVATLTDSEGRFTLTNLPPGLVTICVEADNGNAIYAPIQFLVNLIQFADNEASEPIGLTEAIDAEAFVSGEDIVLESSDNLDVRLEIPAESIGGRYWRVRVVQAGTGSTASIAEIAFLNSAELEPVEAFASSVFFDSPSFDETRAFDGSLSSTWASASGGGVGSWLAVDFGENNITLVNEVQISSQNSRFGPRETPQQFIIEASNDAENWFSVSGVVVTPLWGEGETRTFFPDDIIRETGVVLSALTADQVSGLPFGLEPCGLFVVGPKSLPPLSGVRFSTENYDNLPDGTEVDVWSFRNNDFEIIGTGQVLGNRIETIVDTLTTGAPIGFAPRFHDLSLSSDQASTYLPRSLLGDGALRTVIGLPSYGSLGGPDTTGLIYNSRAADGTALISGTASFDGALPETVTSSVRLSGTAQTFENVINVNGQSQIAQTAIVNGEGLESGAYPVRFLSTARYSCSTVTASTTAVVPLEDGSESPFGPGWSVAEIQRLDINEQGVSIRQGDGSVLQFNAPIPTVGEDFTDNFGGWGVVGPSEGLTYEPSGGNPGGFIQEVDILSNVALVYWQAPTGLLPRLSEFIGGVFSYDMQQNNITRQIGRFEDVVIETGGELTLVYDYPDSVFPGLTWTRFEILKRPCSVFGLNIAQVKILSDSTMSPLVQKLLNLEMDNVSRQALSPLTVISRRSNYRKKVHLSAAILMGRKPFLMKMVCTLRRLIGTAIKQAMPMTIMTALQRLRTRPGK